MTFVCYLKNLHLHINMQALIQDFALDRGEEAPLDDDRSVWESLTPPPPCSTYSMIDSENLFGGGGSEVKTIIQQ